MSKKDTKWFEDLATATVTYEKLKENSKISGNHFITSNQKITAIMEVASDYIPEYVTLRNKIVDTILTIEMNTSDFDKVEEDPKVLRLSVSEKLQHPKKIK